MRRLLWFALALGLVLGIRSSYPVAAQSGEAWQVYTNTDEVNALAVNGAIIWAATSGGVVRGDTLTRESRVVTIDDGLPANQAQAILVDPATGYVWVGTLGGLARWDGASWRVWTVAQGLVADRVDGLGLDAAGRIWATTSAGASVWDGATMRPFRPTTANDGMFAAVAMYYQDVLRAPVPTSIWAIENGSIVWTTIGPGEGVHRYDGNTWTHYTTANMPELPSNLVDAVIINRDGARWFGTANGVVRWRPDGAPSRMHAGELPAGRVKSMAADASGRVWLGIYGCRITCSGGLARIDDKGTASESDDSVRVFYAQSDGLPDDNVNAIAPGADGAMWLATGGGLTRVPAADTVAAPLIAPGPPSNQINALLRDSQARLWVGTDKGLGLFQNGQWTVFNRASVGFPSEQIHAIVEAGGDIWVATGNDPGGGPVGSISRRREVDGAWVHYGVEALGETPGVVTALAVENIAGVGFRIWAGTRGTDTFPPRLFMYDTDGHWTPAWVSGRSGAFGSIRGLSAQNNRVWLATSAGLSYLAHSGNPSLLTPIETFTYENTGGGLLSNDTTAVLADRLDQIWVGTSSGVSMLAWQTLAWRRFTVGNPPNGLPNNYINGIALDNPGNFSIWFLTQDGAARFNRYTPFDWAQTITRRTGIESNNFTSMAYELYCKRWIGTSQGLQLYKYGDCNDTGATPTPFPTRTLTATVTSTPTVTLTPTDLPTLTATVTATGLIPPSVTPTPTLTATPEPTETATPTETPTPTATLAPGETPPATVTPTVTVTPTLTVEPARPFRLYLPLLMAGRKAVRPVV